MDCLATEQTFPSGYLSPNFVTERETMEVVLDGPRILLCGSCIASIDPILALLHDLGHEGTPLLVVAADVVGEALGTLVVDKLRGTLMVTAVRSPDDATLVEIARISGARVVANISSVMRSDLGRAARVVVGKRMTTIIAAS